MIFGEIFPGEASSANTNTFNCDKHFDLIPEEFEGGHKTWECSDDLVGFLTTNSIKGTSILELGCGSARPAIEAFLEGYTHKLHLQDFNIDVLKNVTIRSLFLKNIKVARLFYGDWRDSNLNDALEDYDVILSSETIYRSSLYSPILNLISKHLQSAGAAYISSKNYYFGNELDGNVFDFMDEIGTYTDLEPSIVWKVPGRCIIKIIKRP